MTATRYRPRSAAAIAVVVVIVLELWTMGPAVGLLAVALLVAFAVWVGQPDMSPPRTVLPAYLTAIAVQVAHVGEETTRGLYRDLPPLIGAPPWSEVRFVSFNTAWLCVFAVAAIGIVRRRPMAYLVAFFLAIGGGIGNGLSHIALAVFRRGYFPGLYTGALSLVIGGVLLNRLMRDSGDAGDESRGNGASRLG